MEDVEFLAKMSPETHRYLDNIKKVYNAPFARRAGTEIESISEDEIRCYIDIGPEHINGRGFVHGAVIYTLTDDTLAFAANMTEECVGQNVSIIYHRPLKEGRIISSSRLINQSKSLKIYSIDVHCNGKLISSSTCTAFRVGEKK